MPTRGLVGYRGQFLTETRGTGLLHQIGEGYGPWAGEVEHRTSGVLVLDRAGVSNAYALFNLQERATLYIDAGTAVYEGMIVGLNSRPGDMDVNPTKEKKLTNIRTHSHDEALRLVPPPPMTLETAIESIAADELVEVTPTVIRMRKRLLLAARAAPRARSRGGPATVPVDRETGRGQAERRALRSPVTVYLDHAASSPLRPEVLEADAAAPPGRRRQPLIARTVRAGVPARRSTRPTSASARSIGAEARSIVFTCGGTEAINLAVKGAAWARQGRGPPHHHDRRRAQGGPRVLPAAGDVRLRRAQPAASTATVASIPTS